MTKNQHSQYLALLRGINVGGNNIIPMEELRKCLETIGLQDVQTYIHSGNVLFRSKSNSVKSLTKKIEHVLSQRFDYLARVVVLSRGTFEKSLTSAHRTWGKKDGFKHNAMFAIDGLDVAAMLDQLPPIKRTIETVSYSENVIFWSGSIERIGQTTMMTLGKSDVYKHLTVRNHNTVFKLADLINGPR